MSHPTQQEIITTLVAALKSVKGQFRYNAHHYGCYCGGISPSNDPCFVTRQKVIDAIALVEGEEP